MKKTLLICLTVSLFYSSVCAQKLFEKKVVLGVKIGLSASLFTDDVNLFDPSSTIHDPSFARYVRISPIAGLTVDYTLNKRLSLGAEMLYNTRGMAYRQKNNNVIIINKNGSEQAYNYIKYKLEYIELPLTAHYNFLPPVQDNWLTVYAGLAPGIAVSEKIKIDYPEITAGPGKERDDQSADLNGVRSFNTSVLGGIQFGQRPSKIGIYSDLRASYALLPVFNADSDPNGDNLNTKMFSFSLGIGLKF